MRVRIPSSHMDNEQLFNRLEELLRNAADTQDDMSIIVQAFLDDLQANGYKIVAVKIDD